MLEDIGTNLDLFVRWIHVIAGIAWIGHLYFFNFVNANLQPKLDGAAKKLVNPLLMPRALWWFRWGAMTTFVAGLVLFTLNYMYVPGVGFGPNANWSNAGSITPRAIWILIGMVAGVTMWSNVWFVIWPAQKKLIRWVRDGNPPPEQPKVAARAARASKVNTYLSGPMLFGMLAPNHYGAVGPIVAVVIVLSLVAIFSAYKTAPKVGIEI